MNDEHPERRAEPCEIPALAGPAPDGPGVGLDDSAGNSEEIAVARSSWPFAHEVTHRQVERQELIDRQYAHIPPKVKW